MTDTVAPVLDTVYAAVQSFVIGVTGLAQANVLKGYQNRVASPVGPFCLMTATMNTRLATNFDTWDTVNPAPTTVTAMAAMQLAMQLDLYGPSAGDWAVMLTTLLRDQYGVDALAPDCSPLYSDDPRRAPLVTGEEQWQDRWIVTAQLEYLPVTTAPQDFANAAGPVNLVDVDVVYPP